MFTVIRSSYLNLEIIDDAALKCEECGVSFVYSDKSKLEENRNHMFSCLSPTVGGQPRHFHSATVQ